MAGGSGNHGTHGGPTTKIRDVENSMLLLIYAVALYPFNYCYLLVELVVNLRPWSVEYIRVFKPSRCHNIATQTTHGFPVSVCVVFMRPTAAPTTFTGLPSITMCV